VWAARDARAAGGRVAAGSGGSSWPGRPAEVPAGGIGILLYAVGDIHGELEKLERLLVELPLQAEDRLVFLGDYVDRGPDPFGVVERLVALASERECVFLMGNHESMFLDFLGWRGRAYFGGDAFLMNGGDRTLASYGYFDAENPDPGAFSLPEAHARFFRGLVLSYTEGGYVFVHAGLDRKTLQQSDVRYALSRSSPEEMLWSRVTGDLPHQLGATVVYGHTPSPDLSVQWNVPFSIGIDTGAVYGGPLTALRLPDETVFQAK
jgi:serine/threonine protein phosphatase 1